MTITGPEIETGVAAQAPDSAESTYVTTNASPIVSGSKIEVMVTDKPGNTITFEKLL